MLPPTTFRERFDLWRKGCKVIHFDDGSPIVCKLIKVIKRPHGDWRWSGHYNYNMYRYWCPKCGTVLSEGPSGGASVNCVCKKCRINYGSLPNNEHE